MARTVEYDVVIMGSGVAGMGAAYKIAEAGGVSMAIFEKYPAQGGAVSNCPMGLCITPDTPEAQKAAFEVLCRYSNYSANLGVVSKLVKYSSEFPKIFFEDLGIEVEGGYKRDPKDYGTQRGYGIGHANGLDVGDVYFIKGRGKGHAMALALLRLRLKLEKQGVDFYFSTPIKKIIREENGKVTGAIAYTKDGEEIRIKCKALIVASGGCSSNIEMMIEEGVINPKYKEVFKEGTQVIKTFPDACQDGDGQKAVWAIGGKKTKMVLSADPEVPNPGIRLGENTPWLCKNQFKVVLEQPFVRVNEQGNRFINEEMANQHSAMSQAYNNQTNRCGFVIFDENSVRRMEKGVYDDYVYFIFRGVTVTNLRGQMDEAISQGNQHMCHFDTLKEVCDFMEIDEDGLRKTLAAYNHSCDTGYDENFHTDAKYMNKVEEESGHIYCFRIFPGAYNTMGGLAINENGNVIDEAGYPIEGLYAGGDMVTGSVFGDPPSNAGGSVYGSMPTGMLAGVSAAEYVRAIGFSKEGE